MLGWTNKIPSKITCLVEQAQHHNLPPGIVINRCAATTKVRSMQVILIDTTTQNVWILQPLLAAELFIMDQIDKMEHRANMERKGDNINILFSPVTPNTIRVQSVQVEVTQSNITPPTSSDKPSFSPRPNTNTVDFDFYAEINCPPFKLNMGTNAKMTCDQQSQFLNLIHDHPEVFSLHDKDLGFCDKIKHTIPTTLDKPVYYKALQAVHSSNWFSSFDLVQGYLQLMMAESNKKTAFRGSSVGLYEFTQMPFGLLNAGSGFCCLMEQCLGDQKFVSLLLYLDDICIFALQLMTCWTE